MAASSNPTPLHNVPVEIIQEIIVHAIHQPSALNKSTSSSAVTPNHDLNPHPYSVRATLLSVCRTWRRLVFNTPRMWNVLVFDGVLPPSLQEVEIWLRLSKACPLDVYICLETWFPIPKEVFVYRYTQSMVGNPRDLERVYEMLGGHMDRIRTLVMDLRHCRTACFPSLNVLFPVERVTKMKRLEAFECIGASVGPIGRLHAPRLKKLKTGFNLNVMLERMTMDTVLAVREMEMRIRDETSAEQVESLGLYRNLQRLHLIDTRVANVVEDPQRVSQSDKVPLPSLRSLTISALRANILLPALDTLSAPALESLSFEGCDGSTSFSTSTLASFFALGPSIKDIHIAGVDLKGKPYHHQASSSASNSSSKLTSLHLSQCYIHPSFFPALLTTSSSSTVYPHLAALTLHNCTYELTDLTTFLSAHPSITIAPSCVVS